MTAAHISATEHPWIVAAAAALYVALAFCAWAICKVGGDADAHDGFGPPKDDGEDSTAGGA